jgi:hypothetical protein
MRVAKGFQTRKETRMPESSRNAERQTLLAEELTEFLLGYFTEHPRAGDTLEGIAEWWLQRHQVRVVVECLQRVLVRLCEQGVLEGVGTGPTRRYRLRSRNPQTEP